MSAPQAVAQGSLASTPLLHVLLSIATKEMSGTLAVWPDDDPDRGQDRVLFVRGRPTAARVLEPATVFERSLLPLFHRSRAPYAFYQADLVGDGPEVLRGDIDPMSLAVASLRGGARTEVVAHVLRRFGDQPVRVPMGFDLERFGLTPKERAVIDLLRADPMPVAALIERSGEDRAAPRLMYLMALTGGIEVDDRVPRPSADGSSEGRPRSATHRASDRPRAASARAARTSSAPAARTSSAPAARTSSAPAAPPSSPPRPASATAASTSAGPATHTASERPARPRSSLRDVRPKDPDFAPAPPAGLSKEHEARWREIAARAAAIDKENYFTMLAVGEAAREDEIRDAYFALVKKWHPDRLPRELQALKPWAERIFHYLTEARDVLQDPKKRVPYLKSVREGGGTPEADRKLAALVQMAMEFQKVDVLVRRKRFDEAHEIIDAALELNPEEADYHAGKGWVLFEEHGAGSSAPTTDMLRYLDRAIRLSPRHLRAHFTKATLLKRLGRASEALTHFEIVTKINPRHVEAMRELRLARMRADKKGEGKDEGGLLSKLFGGKK